MPSRSVPRGEVSPRLIEVSAALCLVLAIGAPAATALAWVFSGHPPAWATKLPPPEALRPLGGAIALAPALLLARGVWLARRGLLRFGRNEFFSAETARDIRGFAFWSLLALVASLLAPTVATFALTIGNAPGHRILALSVTPEQLIGLLVAAMFWIVGGVLRKGAEIADENRQFV
jgi:hypothetical protein